MSHNTMPRYNLCPKAPPLSCSSCTSRAAQLFDGEVERHAIVLEANDVAQ